MFDIDYVNYKRNNKKGIELSLSSTNFEDNLSAFINAAIANFEDKTGESASIDLIIHSKFSISRFNLVK